MTNLPDERRGELVAHLAGAALGVHVDHEDLPVDARLTWGATE